MIQHQSSGALGVDPRPTGQAVWRGALGHCPRCGVGRLYSRYLKVVHACATCGQELHHHRADDAPPYVTIFVVGHILVGGVLALEQAMAPPTHIHLAIWLPLALVSCLLLLPVAKGALIGLQWAQRMHGFGADSGQDQPAPVAIDRQQ